jgi:hypothetical protein
VRTSTIAWVATALVVPGLALGTAAFAQQQPEQHAEARVGGQRDPAQPPDQAQPSRPDPARMSGTFALGLPREEAVQRVNHAIDQVVAQMSYFRRSFAMRRLRDRNPIRDEVRTEVSPGFVTVVYGQERHRTPIGQWTNVTAAGEPAELRHELVGDRIVQTFRTNEGQKQTEFVFSPDGRMVRLDITVESPQLPVPLRYSLPYRRTTPSQAPA